MNIASFVITFIVLWWLVFLICLPINIKIEEKPQIGNATSAPSNPNIFAKFCASFLISLILTYFLVFHWQEKIINYFIINT
jgi:predicted secreted protein